MNRPITDYKLFQICWRGIWDVTGECRPFNWAYYDDYEKACAEAYHLNCQYGPAKELYVFPVGDPQ